MKYLRKKANIIFDEVLDNMRELISILRIRDIQYPYKDEVYDIINNIKRITSGYEHIKLFSDLNKRLLDHYNKVYINRMNTKNPKLVKVFFIKYLESRIKALEELDNIHHLRTDKNKVILLYDIIEKVLHKITNKDYNSFEYHNGMNTIIKNFDNSFVDHIMRSLINDIKDSYEDSKNQSYSVFKDKLISSLINFAKYLKIFSEKYPSYMSEYVDI